jgi:hypothetical protein
VRGQVVDTWGRPAEGLPLRILGMGSENPARAWPDVRRWEMRAEVGEVVTDASGAFELRGLAATTRYFLVESPHGELSRTGPAWIEAGSPGRLVLATCVYAVVELRDALTDGPVWRAQLDQEVDPHVRDLHVKALGARFLVRWATLPDESTPPARVKIWAPGFEPQVVTLEPRAGSGTPALETADATVVRLARVAGTRAGAIHLRMPAGVRSIVQRASGSLSRLEGTRAFGSTARLVNRGEYWDVENAGGAGRWGLPKVLGLSPPAYVEGVEGELVEVDLTGPAWGRVELRLKADSDLCRGTFYVSVEPSRAIEGHFPITADANGHVDAGWWPPGPLTFYVMRSAESGGSETVEVRPGTEPTVVEITIRNLLTR